MTACGESGDAAGTGGETTSIASSNGTSVAATSTATGGEALGGAGGAQEGGALGLKFIAEESGVALALHDAWSFGDGDAYAVGADGTIVRRSGGTWSPEVSGTTEFLSRAWAGGTQSRYAAGGLNEGVILRSSGDGVWVSEALPVGTGRIWAISGTNGDDVYAHAGTSILHRFNGIWIDAIDPPPNTFTLWVSAPDELFAGSFARVHHWLNDSWIDEPAPGEQISDVCGLGMDVIEVAEHNGGGRRSALGWELLQPDVPEPARCRFASVGRAFVFGNNGNGGNPLKGRISQVLGGENGVIETFDVPETVWGGGASANDVIAVGDGGRIWRASIIDPINR
jgi:hypothetical protein